MTIRRNAAASACAALALLVGAHAAHAKPAVADPLARADTSFSPHRLNRPTRPQSIGKPANCFDGECEWIDKSGVAHSFGGKLLAIKSISLRPGDRRALSALGIGTARARPAVLTRVRAFLPEIKIDCLEPGQAGEGQGIASCSGSFRTGAWLKLLFGPDGQLTQARIDAFQIN